MNGDHKQKKQKKAGKLPSDFFDAGNVLFTIWVRLLIPDSNGPNWIILDGRRSLLLSFRLFLAGVYLTYQILK